MCAQNWLWAEIKGNQIYQLIYLMIYVATIFTVVFNCLIEFVLLFLGLSSIVDGIEANTFQNILDDSDDEEESGVTTLGESEIILKELVNFYLL